MKRPPAKNEKGSSRILRPQRWCTVMRHSGFTRNQTSENRAKLRHAILCDGFMPIGAEAVEGNSVQFPAEENHDKNDSYYPNERSRCLTARR